jgi:predicted TIM-barrel fold metal-dependent hydrolase
MSAHFRATAPSFTPPVGTTDCHIHIVGRPEQYPFAAGRSYSTIPATVDDYRAVMASLGVSRTVVVQPSFYGTDNRCTVDALRALGEAAHGVAVIDPDISDRDLEALHQAGCRGARLNVGTSPAGADIAVEAMAERIDARVRSLSWHIQIFTMPALLPRFAAVQRRLASPLVIDHFGMLRPELIAVEPMRSQLQALLAILDGGGWVKLSGLYRVADDFLAPSLAALARRLTERAPERTVWGSDWPHTPPHSRMAADQQPLLPFRDIDTGQLLSPAASWFPDEETRRRVLVENPARLYGFA